MIEALLSVLVLLLFVAIVLLALVLRSASRDPAASLAPKIEALSGTQERTERRVQDELKRNREALPPRHIENPVQPSGEEQRISGNGKPCRKRRDREPVGAEEPEHKAVIKYDETNK